MLLLLGACLSNTMKCEDGRLGLLLVVLTVRIAQTTYFRSLRSHRNCDWILTTYENHQSTKPACFDTGGGRSCTGVHFLDTMGGLRQGRTRGARHAEMISASSYPPKVTCGEKHASVYRQANKIRASTMFVRTQQTPPRQRYYRTFWPANGMNWTVVDSPGSATNAFVLKRPVASVVSVT